MPEKVQVQGLDSLDCELENSNDLKRVEEYWHLNALERRNVKEQDTNTNTNTPVLVALGPVLYCLSLLYQGAYQTSKNTNISRVFVAVHPQWIQKQGNQLYLRCGYTFHLTERRFILYQFTYPRCIGYFINYLSLHSWFEVPRMLPLCEAAYELEQDYMGAQSSSAVIEPSINDKLFTRCLLSQVGVDVPAFVAFKRNDTACSLKRKLLRPWYENQSIILVSQEQQKEIVEKALLEFTKQQRDATGWVVKPCGARFSSCDGVKMFRVDEWDSLLKYTCHLLTECHGEESVLVDKRVSQRPMKLKDGTEFDYVLRVICSRSVKGPVTCGALARVGSKNGPVNAGSTGGCWTRAEEAFQLAGLNVSSAIRSLQSLGPFFFKAWDAYEQKRVKSLHESPHAQTDLVGLDVMMRDVDDDVVPCVIEVNDHDCGGFDAYTALYSNDQALQPGVSHAMTAPFLEYAILRMDQLNMTAVVTEPLSSKPPASSLLYNCKSFI